MNKLKALVAASALALTSMTSFATAGAVETAVTTAVQDAKTAGDNILAIAATVLASFLLFKLATRAGKKI